MRVVNPVAAASLELNNYQAREDSYYKSPRSAPFYRISSAWVSEQTNKQTNKQTNNSAIEIDWTMVS